MLGFLCYFHIPPVDTDWRHVLAAPRCEGEGSVSVLEMEKQMWASQCQQVFDALMRCWVSDPAPTSEIPPQPAEYRKPPHEAPWTQVSDAGDKKELNKATQTFLRVSFPSFISLSDHLNCIYSRFLMTNIIPQEKHAFIADAIAFGSMCHWKNCDFFCQPCLVSAFFILVVIY